MHVFLYIYIYINININIILIVIVVFTITIITIIVIYCSCISSPSRFASKISPHRCDTRSGLGARMWPNVTTLSRGWQFFIRCDAPWMPCQNPAGKSNQMGGTPQNRKCAMAKPQTPMQESPPKNPCVEYQPTDGCMFLELADGV